MSETDDATGPAPARTAPALRWVVLGLVAAALVLVAWRPWAAAPQAAKPPLPLPADELKPGNPPTIYFGRAALVVETDAVDMIESVAVTREGKTVIPTFSWVSPQRVVVLVARQPLDVEVRTQHRTVKESVAPQGNAAPLVLRTIDLPDVTADDWRALKPAFLGVGYALELSQGPSARRSWVYDVISGHAMKPPRPEGSGTEAARPQPHLVFTHSGSGAAELRYHGRTQSSVDLAPLTPHFTKTDITGWSLTDGNALVGARDGRLWWLDIARSKEGIEALGVNPPHPLGGPIPSGPRFVYAPIDAVAISKPRDGQPGALLCLTGEDRYVGDDTGAAPGVHPEAHALHAFDLAQGPAVRLWRYDGPGRPRSLWLSPDGRWLAFSYVNAEKNEHGVAMMDLRRAGKVEDRILWRAPVDGPLGPHAAWSPDGRLLAVLQGPSNEGAPLRVWILH